MSTVLLNVRLDADLKKQAEELFSDFGMTMTTAVNVFLRQAVREQALPFTVSRERPNAELRAAMEEGERIAHDPNAPTYHSMDELKASLEA